MQFKSYTLVLNLCLCAMFAPHGLAQSPKASPEPKEGYIRIWNMLPATNGTFSLRKAGSAPSEPDLFARATSYNYASYFGLPPAKYRLAVHKSGDTTTPLKTVEVDLKPDYFFTILISPKAGAVNVEIVNDTIKPDAATGTVTIRNYFPGATVAVSTATMAISDALAYGESHTATGLPLDRVSMRLNVRLAEGAPIQSRVEPDLKGVTRATLLIIPDSYGRFAPIVTFDGKNL